jgi:hypothetical protein
MVPGANCPDVACLSQLSFSNEQCLLIQENWDQRIVFDEAVSVPIDANMHATAPVAP